MILILLRTGMRICELLSTKIQDISLRERKILIFESAKNRIGRVVCLSEDARFALRKWIKIRSQKTDDLSFWVHELSFCAMTCPINFSRGKRAMRI